MMKKNTITSSSNQHDSTQSGWTFWLTISCLTVTASCSFAFGYGIGAPNLYTDFTEPFLRKHFGICDVLNERVRVANNCTNVSSLRNETLASELMNGLPQSVFIIGCFVGSLTGGYFSQMSSEPTGLKARLFTRRNAFHFNYPFMYLSCAFLFASYYLKAPSLFYLSRLFHGYQSGMACAIVPVYISEISSKRIRGSTGVIHQVFITLGILIAQLLAFALAKYRTWVYGMNAIVVPCIIAHFIIPTLPESPEQLLLVKGDKVEAIHSLRKLRGVAACIDYHRKKTRNTIIFLGFVLIDEVEDVSADIDLIQSSRSTTSNQKSASIKEMLKNPITKWAVITSLAILLIQALSGINAIFFYSSKVFKIAGITESKLPYANAFAGFINVLATFAVILMIDRFGRKPLLVYPMALMLVIFVALTVTIQINEVRKSISLGYLSVVLTLVFICLFAVGLGPIAFIYPNEVIRQAGRDSVFRIGLCLNYFGNLFLSLFFPLVNRLLRGYVFLIFFMVVAAGVALLCIKMPETKNKTIEEIEEYWRKRSKGARKLDNDHISQTHPLTHSLGPTV